MKTLFFAIGLFTIALSPVSAAAQQTTISPVPGLTTAIDLERVRTLYGSAAYEEALAAMPVVNGEPVKTDVEQYRALCLLALGREPEAISTVERLVRDNPLYLPSSSDTSPRMQAIFNSARAKLVPDAAKRAYTEGKTAYEAKNREAAHAAFRRTIDLVESLPDADRKNLSDLRLLAGEFLELSAPAPKPAPPPAPSSPAANASAKPPVTGEYVPPVAVRETLPSWNPPDNAARRNEYTGLIRVQISPEGKVTDAAVLKPSHPLYDALVVTAANRWQYKPATRGGQPVASSKEIQIRLVPN